jgi:hypothetical protein
VNLPTQINKTLDKMSTPFKIPKVTATTGPPPPPPPPTAPTPVPMQIVKVSAIGQPKKTVVMRIVDTSNRKAPHRLLISALMAETDVLADDIYEDYKLEMSRWGFDANLSCFIGRHPADLANYIRAKGEMRMATTEGVTYVLRPHADTFIIPDAKQANKKVYTWTVFSMHARCELDDDEAEVMPRGLLGRR